MELFIGPIIAVIASAAYTAGSVLRLEETNVKLVDKIESLERRLDVSDKETLQKVMKTVMPIAKAVNKLNNEVGIS